MTSHYASSRIREIEHRSASACKYEPSTLILTDDAWRIAQVGEVDDYAFDNGGGEPTEISNHVPCIAMAEGTSVRVAPMQKSRGGWDDEHFHERMRLPEGSNVGKGMVIMLEAIGRECVAIALSPYHSFDLGKTYVVHFGANGNLTTVLRRRINYDEAVDTSFPSRVCAEDHWVPYWIILQRGKLSAGVGRIPGKRCIGTLDDSMYNMLRSGMDAVRYVGLGNSALGRNARDVRVRNVWIMSIPSCFGLEGIPIEEEGKFVNILEEYGGGDRESGMDADGGTGGGTIPTDAELLAEYEKERSKARARAEKFGIEYKEPAPDAFLRWSEARRLRANPERGFITGIDTFSTEEKAKANARKERFAREERKRKGLDDEAEDGGANVGLGDGEDEMNADAMEDNDGADDVAEWEKTKKDPLPIEQAWDNWKLVQKFRVDPPSSLVEDEVANGIEEEEEDEEGFSKKIVPVPTKIHIFSIDWAPFKQIRTDDIMSYFKDYGPSYVEWLGELSCNILFEDKHSAARAFHAMSQELPSPPPESLVSAANNTNDANDEKAKSMMEQEEVVVTSNEYGEDKKENENDVNEGSPNQDEEKSLPDYGGMGWRFCKWTVRKVSNDNFGRRGTRARILMRLANSADVLNERPTEWPRPPPGFTTKRVLMPWHDFSKRHHRGKRDTKRRRRDGRRDRSHYDDGDNIGDGVESEHPMLSKGLKSGRAGFSIEELEAEREAKRAVEEAM